MTDYRPKNGPTTVSLSVPSVSSCSKQAFFHGCFNCYDYICFHDIIPANIRTR